MAKVSIGYRRGMIVLSVLGRALGLWRGRGMIDVPGLDYIWAESEVVDEHGRIYDEVATAQRKEKADG